MERTKWYGWKDTLTKSNSKKWYSRKHMTFAGFVLFVTGICAAIILFPINLILAFSLFALIGGPGIFIGYKRKDFLAICVGLGITAWGYEFYASLLGPAVQRAFLDIIWSKVLPAVYLPTLLVAWLAWFKTHRHTSLKSALAAFLIAAFACGMITVPLVSAVMLDYNHRADASVSEVISMKIVSKEDDDELGYTIWIETQDRGLEFWLIFVRPAFYDQHSLGDMIDVEVRSGALGYAWIEDYR